MGESFHESNFSFKVKGLPSRPLMLFQDLLIKGSVFLPGDHRPQGIYKAPSAHCHTSCTRKPLCWETSAITLTFCPDGVCKYGISACNVHWDKALTHLWDICYILLIFQLYPGVVSRQYSRRPSPLDVLPDPAQQPLLCKSKGSSSGLENDIQALGSEICPGLQIGVHLECVELCLVMSQVRSQSRAYGSWSWATCFRRSWLSRLD